MPRFISWMAPPVSGSAAAIYQEQRALYQNATTATASGLGAIYSVAEDRWTATTGSTIIWEGEVERAQRAYVEREERCRAALGRSRELLLEHLTPAQRRTFEENQWFVVRGGVTKKRYRIKTTGYTGNIEELERGHSERAVARLCGHLSGPYALHDHHVAQKISLECDEEAFLRLCNRQNVA